MTAAGGVSALLAKQGEMQLSMPGVGEAAAEDIAKELSARLGTQVRASRPSVSLETFFLSTVARDAPEFKLAPFLSR